MFKMNFKMELRMTLLRADNYGDLALHENIRCIVLPLAIALNCKPLFSQPVHLNVNTGVFVHDLLIYVVS